MVFGASFGWGMLVVAPVLFCWQGSIYLVAKFLSASFFTGPLVTEISIVGGFLIACSGLALLKIRDVKTLNFLRSEEHTSELQSRGHIVYRLLLENKKLSKEHEKRQ